MKFFISLFFLLILVDHTILQSGTTVEISNLNDGEVRVAGFRLISGKEIFIEAEGAGEERKSKKIKNFMVDPQNMFAYCWIIDARTREIVWRMTISNTNRERSRRFNRSYKDKIELPPGEYELYYSARKPGWGFFDDGFFSLGRLLDKLLSDEDWFEETQKDWFVRISGVDESVDAESVNKYHRALKNQAVISITGLSDSDFKQEGFKLKKSGKFKVYAVGEAFKNEAYDYGWIVEASSSSKVWETLPENGEYAGGAIKNRKWEEKISLDAGDYWVYFVMDDSHSLDDWNSNPPYDPDFYGITLTGIKGEFDPNSIDKLIKVKVKPIVELTRLGDDELVQEGFKINQPMKIRVYALGEGRNGNMYDYGWILNRDTGEKVWQMEYNRTRNGGGADKNRLIDEVITLSSGSYIVYYVTDGSHSYREWNSRMPYNPINWGITVYPADPKYGEKQIEKLRKFGTTENVLSQIVQVRDGRDIQKRFHIEETMPIRIYAIGEGDWDEMYDYAWIEDEDEDNIIWEMTYQKTRWAGGAKKNRKVDQRFVLPPGNFVLHYRSDDSHSFNDWNDDPPDDPLHYGITIYKTEE